MIRRSPFFYLVGLVLVVSGCRGAGGRKIDGTRLRPLFEGMGSHHRAITTSSPTAQKYFDQGLIFAYAFNHDEAIRSFKEAARHDPDCAMAWWGISLCNGPHINNAEMDEAHSQAAWAALQKAIARIDKAGPIEQELIRALSKRYADPVPKDRKPLDQAYADAMREVWKRHRTDADLGTLFAESMMDLCRWDLWTKDKKPHPGTEEVVAVLEEVLRLDKDNPGANHLYIHAMEASAEPLKALAAADHLRNLVPAAGHLVHMPSHIDIHAGQWAKAAETNVRAVEADRQYRAISPRQGIYNFYMAHNRHFLAFASMMEGNSDTALKSARDAIAGIPADWAKQNAALVDGFMAVELEVLMRFGRWDDLLREPSLREYFRVATALWHFARGVAHAAKGQIEQAQGEQTVFRKAVKHVAPDAKVGNSPASKVLGVAEQMLAGEIALRRGAIDEAVAELRKGIAIEDDLTYDEPPDWPQPVRHTLGAVLLSAGRYEDAEKVYREDLQKWPENGWSLYGLTKALESQGKSAEAQQIDSRFRKAWARADTPIASSCLCVKGKS